MPLVVLFDIVLLLFLMCLLYTCFSVPSHTKTLCWFQSHSFNQKVRIHSRLLPFQKAGLLPTGCGSLNYSNLPSKVPWDNFVIMWSYTNKVELNWTELNWISQPHSIFPRIDKRQADRGSSERQGALILTRHPVSLPLHLSLSPMSSVLMYVSTILIMYLYTGQTAHCHQERRCLEKVIITRGGQICITGLHVGGIHMRTGKCVLN